MVQGQKHQSRWEFRKQDCTDPSDDASESNSSAEPVKLKQLSDLMSSKSKLQNDISISPPMKDKFLEKGNRMQTGKRKKKRSASKRRSDGDDLRNKKGTDELDSINSNLLYMQSILEELRVGRENMFEWMRGEIRKMMGDTIPRHLEDEGCSKWKRIKLAHHNSGESMIIEPAKGGVGMPTKEANSLVNPNHMQFPTSSTHLTLPTILPKTEYGNR